MWSRVFVAGLALALAACSGSHTAGDGGSPPADSGAADAGAFAGAYLTPGCAPDDGPALTLTLFEAAAPECSADAARRSITIDFFEGSTTFFPIEAPETITSSTSSGGFGNGIATECPGGTPPCRTSVEWSLTFDTYTEGTRGTGSYSITFDGGEVRSGRFDAAWCSPAPVLCG